MPVKVNFPANEKIVAALASGKIKAEEVFYRLKEMIERCDGNINSFAHLVDTYSQPVSAPLHGLPFAVKDIIDTKGVPTEYGSAIFSGHMPGTDATVVKSLKRSGGIIQGKTSTHEFAMGVVTQQSRNPWHTKRITGGSSGGSAAALAAGFSVFALGTDTAGSIRIPAAFCGVTGLKPSTGKLSVKGIYPEAWSLDTVGPMCRHASDIPFLLGAMGYSPGPCKPWKNSRAAIITNFVDSANPEVIRLFNSFLSTLSSEDLVQEEEISIPELDEVALMDDLMDSAENSAVQKELFRKSPDKFTYLSRKQLEYSSNIKASDYIASQRARKKYISLFRRLHKKFRFLLSPTMPEIAPNWQEIIDKPPEFYLKYVSYTNLYNFTRDPAITIPIGFASGMPVGAQISSAWGDDLSICGIAAEYQKISDHHLMYPDSMAKNARMLTESIA